MGKQETPLQNLQVFLPDNTFQYIAPYFQDNNIHLTLTRERKSVLGDYREPTRSAPYHRITINVNLNPYNFLITLVHELAHMVTCQDFGRSVKPHGKEWKSNFKKMLMPYVGKGVFPDDVELALMKYISNPAASTCTDSDLYKALYKYDSNKKPNQTLMCYLPLGATFKTDSGIFKKVKQLRTRSLCKDVGTGKLYYFPGIYEVEQLPL